jgi:hypothetical protein
MISVICRRRSGCALGEVDLVDDRDDLEVVLDREVGVGERLRLDALRRVDDQQRPFAGRQRADLAGEVDVARRVDQVEDVNSPVLARVVEADRVRLDGDATLALESMASRTCASISRAWRARDSKAVGKRRLAMVDVRDDRKISDVTWFQPV